MPWSVCVMSEETHLDVGRRLGFVETDRPARPHEDGARRCPGLVRMERLGGGVSRRVAVCSVPFVVVLLERRGIEIATGASASDPAEQTRHPADCDRPVLDGRPKRRTCGHEQTRAYYGAHDCTASRPHEWSRVAVVRPGAFRDNGKKPQPPAARKAADQRAANPLPDDASEKRANQPGRYAPTGEVPHPAGDLLASTNGRTPNALATALAFGVDLAISDDFLGTVHVFTSTGRGHGGAGTPRL